MQQWTVLANPVKLSKDTHDEWISNRIFKHNCLVRADQREKVIFNFATD